MGISWSLHKGVVKVLLVMVIPREMRKGVQGLVCSCGKVGDSSVAEKTGNPLRGLSALGVGLLLGASCSVR